MRITVTDGNNFHNFDVEPNEEIDNLKALIEAEVHQLKFRQESHLKIKLCFTRTANSRTTKNWTNSTSGRTQCYFSQSQFSRDRKEANRSLESPA